MNEIDFINLPLDLEQELEGGYIKLTGNDFGGRTNYHLQNDFGGYTNHYLQKGEVLDESHNVIGNFTINARVGSVDESENRFNFHHSRIITLEGDIEKILSLKKKI